MFVVLVGWPLSVGTCQWGRRISRYWLPFLWPWDRTHSSRWVLGAVAYISLLLNPHPSFCSLAGPWQVLEGQARKTGFSGACPGFHSSNVAGWGETLTFEGEASEPPWKGCCVSGFCFMLSLKSDCPASSPSPASYQPSNLILNPSFFP